jgi:hypothetical protein
VALGNFEIVFLRRAAVAAFRMFFLAAVVCFVVAMVGSPGLIPPTCLLLAHIQVGSRRLQDVDTVDDNSTIKHFSALSRRGE